VSKTSKELCTDVLDWISTVVNGHKYELSYTFKELVKNGVKHYREKLAEFEEPSTDKELRAKIEFLERQLYGEPYKPPVPKDNEFCPYCEEPVGDSKVIGIGMLTFCSKEHAEAHEKIYFETTIRLARESNEPKVFHICPKCGGTGNWGGSSEKPNLLRHLCGHIVTFNEWKELETTDTYRPLTREMVSPEIWHRYGLDEE
jgi:hypothetical protein